MVDACDFGHMIDVIDDVFKRWPRDLRRPLFTYLVRLTIACDRIGIFVFLLNGIDCRITLFGLSFIRLAPVLIDERLVIVDHHYSAIASDGLQHLIGHVPRMIRKHPR